MHFLGQAENAPFYILNMFSSLSTIDVNDVVCAIMRSIYHFIIMSAPSSTQPVMN